MKLRKLLFGLCAILVVLASCRWDKPATAPSQSEDDTITCIGHPPVPVMLDSPSLRQRYLALHFWDLVNVPDTHYIHHPKLLDARWDRYILLLAGVDSSTAHQSLERLITRFIANPPLTLYFLQKAEGTWYDPNGRLRQPQLYQYALDALEGTGVQDDAFLHYLAQVPMLRRNSLGTTAQDFTYTDRHGHRGTLHALRSPYLLLYLNNPDCQACQVLRRQFTQAPQLQQWIGKGQVTVLSVYTDDDEAMWEKCCQEYPAAWIVARDHHQQISEQGLYDLQAIPSLYLLDRDKQVLLRDAALGSILSYLQRVLE